MAARSSPPVRRRRRSQSFSDVDARPEQDYRRQFQGIAATLNLDTRCSEAAWTYFTRLQACGLKPVMPPEHSHVKAWQVWSAAGIFIALSKAWNGVQLPQLLHATEVPIGTLFEFLDASCQTLVLGSLRGHVRELRAHYNNCTMLYNKFKRLWSTQLRLPANQLVMDFTWRLFIFVKAEQRDKGEHAPGIPYALNLLLACIYFVVLNATTLPEHIFKVPDDYPVNKLTVAELVAATVLRVDVEEVEGLVAVVTASVKAMFNSALLVGVVHNPVQLAAGNREVAAALEERRRTKQERSARKRLSEAAADTVKSGGKEDTTGVAVLAAVAAATSDIDGSEGEQAAGYASDEYEGLEEPEEATFLNLRHVTPNSASLHNKYAERFIRAITDLDERIFLKSEVTMVGTPAKLFRSQHGGILTAAMHTRGRRLFVDEADTHSPIVKPPGVAAVYKGLNLTPDTKGGDAAAAAAGAQTDSESKQQDAEAESPPAAITRNPTFEKPPIPTVDFTQRPRPESSHIWATQDASVKTPVKKSLQTPISSQLAAHRWVESVLSGLPDEPSARLLDFFKSCDEDLTQEIMERVQSMAGAVQIKTRRRSSSAASSGGGERSVSPVPTAARSLFGGGTVDTLGSKPDAAKEAESGEGGKTEPPTMSLGTAPVLGSLSSGASSGRLTLAAPAPRQPGGFLAEKRRYGVRLYFKVLETMLVNESKRLGKKNFTTLLKMDGFHRALMACAMEVVLQSYHLGSLQFPRIMKLLNVEPYDLMRVIESFLRAESSLPTLLKLHMSHVEERLLEECMWEADSPVFAMLQDPSHAHIGVALRKVHRLAALRVDELTHEMNITDEKFVNEIWTTVKYALAEPQVLLKGRHLGQIIICSVYAVCRIHKKPCSFNHILQRYRRLFGVITRIAHNIDLGSGKGRGSIVELYNQAFVPHMKSHVLGYQNATEKVEKLPRPRLRKAKQFEATNIYISPRQPRYSRRRSPREDVMMSPGTCAMYAMGETSTGGLDLINKAMKRVSPLRAVVERSSQWGASGSNARPPLHAGARKRPPPPGLPMPPEEEGQPPSKRQRTESQ